MRVVESEVAGEAGVRVRGEVEGKEVRSITVLICVADKCTFDEISLLLPLLTIL